METAHRLPTPVEQLLVRRIHDENGAPEVVVYQHYPRSESETPALSVHSGHSTTQLHQAVWSHAEHGPVFSIPSPYSQAYPSALKVPPVEVESEPEKRICGIRKHIFILFLGLAGLVLLGVGVGVGVGVGIGNQKHGTQPSSEPVPELKCPGSTNIQLQSASGARFLHLCGIDYSGHFQATDIAKQPSDTFAACMDACAITDGCSGFGWGPRNKTEGGRDVCWMKNNLNLSHTAAPDFHFGILLHS